MKKLKKIIIIISIILVILIIAIIALTKKNASNENEYEVSFDPGDPIDNDIGLTIKEYFVIDSCVQMFVDELNVESSRYYGRNENNEYVKVVEEKEVKSNIYGLLSKSYITKNNISVDNVYEHINTAKKKRMTTVVEIYSKTDNKNVMSYTVKGLINETGDMTKSEEIYLIVNIDSKNKTFSVEPLSNNVDLEKIQVTAEEQNIEKNDNNQYYEEEITNEKIARKYFEDYKNVILLRPDIAYTRLNEEYKQKRFSTLKKFEKYINENRKMLEILNITKYEVIIDEEGKNQYVCEDQFKNIYIFNENKTLDYNVLLDLYTIEIPQFIEKYDNANAQGKVLLNIEKIIQALNSKDYSYIYSKLASGFKNNKYQTQEDLSTYLESTVYEYNSTEYGKFANEGETYIYNVTLNNKMNKTATPINMQIIMKLKENRDFEFSFNIK